MTRLIQSRKIKCITLRLDFELPCACADSINFTWWSLRPRAMLKNQLQQSDRLIYHEHDTDVTTLFIF